MEVSSGNLSLGAGVVTPTYMMDALPADRQEDRGSLSRLESAPTWGPPDDNVSTHRVAGVDRESRAHAGAVPSLGATNLRRQGRLGRTAGRSLRRVPMAVLAVCILGGVAYWVAGAGGSDGGPSEFQPGAMNNSTVHVQRESWTLGDAVENLRRPSSDPEPSALQISGVLLGEDGRPVKPQTFDLEFVDGDREVRCELMSDGSWKAQLSIGTWLVAAVERKCAVLVPLEPNEVLVQATAERYTLRVRSRSEVGTLQGRVLDCVGSPLPDIGVIIAGHHTTTERNGEFRFDCIQGGWPHLVSLDSSTLPPGILPPWWQQQDNLQTYGEGPLAIPGELFDIAVGTGVTVHGSATGPNGELLRDSTLSFRVHSVGLVGVGGANYVCSTDSMGRFKTEPLPPGRWVARLYGATSEGNAVPDEIGFELECGGKDRELTLKFKEGLGTCSVRGKITDLGGRDPAGLCVALWQDRPELTPENRSHFQAKAFSGVDNFGRFAMSGLDKGKYLVARILSQNPHSDVLYIDRHDHAFIEIDACEEPREIEWVTMSTATAALTLRVFGAEQGEPPRRLIFRTYFGHRDEPVTRVLSFSSAAFELKVDSLPMGLTEATLEEERDGSWYEKAKTGIVFLEGAETLVLCDCENLWQP